jgi:putative membrane protein (TIGR04086 family)
MQNLRTRSKSARERHIAVNIAVGALASLIFVLLLLMILSAFTSSGKIPENMMGLGVVICVFLSSVIGARFAISRAADKRILIGFCQSVLLFVVVFAVGRAVFADARLGAVTLYILIAAMAGGILGGYSGRKSRKKSRR